MTIRRRSGYEINSGYDIDDGPTRHGVLKYPWAKMKVGDSFFVAEADNALRKKLSHSLYHSGRTWLLRRHLDKEFRIAQRQRTEHGIKGGRVWMLAKDGGEKTNA